MPIGTECACFTHADVALLSAGEEPALVLNAKDFSATHAFDSAVQVLVVLLALLILAQFVEAPGK